MATFEIKMPDGSVYEIDGPDEQTALNALRKHLGSAQPEQQAEMTPLQKLRAMPEDQRKAYVADYSQRMNEDAVMEQTGGLASGAASFLQGVPFIGEYFDEAAGTVAPMFSDNTPEQVTNATRRMQSGMERKYPKTSLGLKVAGGVTGSIPALAALPAAASYAPATLGGRALYSAGLGGILGATEGAVSGYGSGKDEQSRSDNAKTRAVIGSVLGTTIGGALPFAKEGLSSATRWTLDRFNVAREARQAGLSRPSFEILTRAMDADGSLNGQGAQRLTAAGPDAMLADAGPNARTLLDATIQKSGRAGVMAGEAVEQRATRANQVVNSALNRTLGPPQGMQMMETGIRQGSAPARQAAYDAAYAAPIDYATPQGMNLQAMLERVPGNVIQQANRLMQIEGVRSNQIMARIADDGSVTFERLPDVRQMDYITRAINLAAESGDGAGALGGQTALGRAYQNLSRDMRQTLRRLVPEYGVALDTAAEPIAARHALTFGERLFNRSTTRDEVANTLASMSHAERQQAAAGLRSYIDERLSNVTRAAADANMDAREAVAAVKDLSSRANREKVTALVGPQEAARVFRAIDQAATALELRAGVAQNSKTFARTEMDRTIRDFTDSGVLSAIRSGEPINATKRVVQTLLGGTPEAKQAVSDRVYDEIARALVSPNPQGLLGNLQRIARQNPRNRAIARQIGSLLGNVGLAGPFYQTGTQALLGQELFQGR